MGDAADMVNDDSPPDGMGCGYIAKAKSTDWNTPMVVVEAVREAFGGTIDLDPCSNETSIVGATTEWRLPDQDGRVEPWDGNVYVNPPFGRGLAAWVEKALESQSAAETIMLLPAAVDTRHWQRLIFPNAAGICWVRGRLKFLGATASAPMACALVWFSQAMYPKDREAFDLAMRKIGTVHL